MDAVLRRLLPPSSAAATYFPPWPVPRRGWVLRKVSEKWAAACCCLCSDDISSQPQWLCLWRRRQRQRKLLPRLDGRNGAGRGAGCVVVAAEKRNKKNRKSGADGIEPLLDENEFFFPEAVLLKKRTVQEDGRVLPEFADAEEEKLFEYLNLQLESDIQMERMRHYEVVYLIHEGHLHEVDDVVSKVQDFIREKKGKIWRLNNWGLRRLAYKIKKAKNANYILMNFELEAKCINDFKSMLDKDERIIRHLVIKRDEAITEDCPPPPEFHTLKAGGIDEDADEEYDDGELGVYNVEDEDFGNIILVDEAEEEGDHDIPHKDVKISKARRDKVTS